MSPGMFEPSPAVRDSDRLASLASSGILNAKISDPDRYARIAAAAIGAPLALLSIVDDRRQHFVGQCGLAEPLATERSTPLEQSYCRIVVETDRPLVVTDSVVDPRVRDHPANTALGVAAYVGVPVRGIDGAVLGSLCLIDDRPRAWTEAELGLLHDIATSIESELALIDVSERLTDRLEIERAERDYESALAGVSEATNRAAGVRATSSALVTHGAAVVGASLISLAIVDGNQVVFHHGPAIDVGVAARWTSAPIDAELPMVQSAVGGATITLPDLDAIAAWPILESEVSDLGIESFAALPVWADDGSFRGAVGLGWSHPLPDRALPSGTARLVDLTVRALSRAHRFESTREQADLLEQLVIPSRLVQVDDLDIRAAYLPPSSLQRVGGDVYDVVRCDDDSIGVLIADATGHDLEATRTAARLRHAAGALTLEGFSPAELMRATNRYVMRSSAIRLATCVSMKFDAARRSVTVANAGHLPPRLLRRDGSVEVIGIIGQPLLGLQHVDYDEITVAIEPGDTVIGFTDGLIERRNHSMLEGERWLEERITSRTGQEAQRLLDSLIGVVVDEERSDDVAIVVVRVPNGDEASVPSFRSWSWAAKTVVLSTMRAEIADVLTDRDRGDLIETVELIATELVTNACQASVDDDNISLSLEFDGPTVIVTVRNPGRAQQSVDPMPPAESVRGRGLPIVRALSSEVDVSVLDGHVVVTATLRP